MHNDSLTHPLPPPPHHLHFVYIHTTWYCTTHQLLPLGEEGRGEPPHTHPGCEAITLPSIRGVGYEGMPAFWYCC